MINHTTSLMKLSICVCLFVAFTFTSCAQQNNQTQSSNTQTVLKVRIPVEGMTCSVCQANVKHSIESVEGVQDVDVSLKDKMAYVTFDSSNVKSEMIRDAINKKGFKAGQVQIEKQ